MQIGSFNYTIERAIRDDGGIDLTDPQEHTTSIETSRSNARAAIGPRDICDLPV